MGRVRYKVVSSRVNQQKMRRRQEALGVFLVVLGILAFYCVLFPAGAGLWGRHIKGALSCAFGVARFFVPLWVIYVGIRTAISKPWPQVVLRLVFWTSLIFFFCTLSSLFGQAAFQLNYGGLVGKSGYHFFSKLFGVPGAWIVSLLGASLSVCGLMRLSPVEIAEKLMRRLREDMTEWREALRRSQLKRPPVVKPRPVVAPEPANPPQISIPPKIESAPVPAPVVTRSTETPAIKPVSAKKAPVPTAAKEQVKPTKTEKTETSSPEQAPAPYQLPPLDLLKDPKAQSGELSENDLRTKAQLLEKTLSHFNVVARVTDIHPGPVITRYDLEPAPGVKISSIVNLADDIALAMKATRVRVLAPIPGKGAVGIEIPNPKSVTVTLKEIVSDARFQTASSPLTVALGKTSSGDPYITDLAPMPHVLIAGATGSGKSVCVHSLIVSILMRATPDQVKFVLIDPKRLELPTYEGMPHLYDPRNGPDQARVITQPKEAAKALVRMVKIMEHRYELFSEANVRNIEGYNNKRVAAGLPPEYYIVVIIDELADLMLLSAREVEDCIQRLAQMARAVGIHLVLATQRPSVDVITGVIKANLPARIAFRVASQMDSRVILDTIGAESLVGTGDMLFLPAGEPSPIRMQGAFVSEKEVEAVVGFTKNQAQPKYEDVFATMAAAQSAHADAESKAEMDEALRLVMERKRVSQDLLKAHFGSSARASNILSLLEVRGFIHKPEGTNRWEIYFDVIEDYFRSDAPQKKAEKEEMAE